MTGPGAVNDNDMLEVCHGGQTYSEYAAQFSTWAILASPLILGNDIRSISAECMAIIGNREVIAVNQDPLVVRGKLVLQWPQAQWPAVDPPAPARTRRAAADAPLPLGSLLMQPCNASDAAQLFTWSSSDRLLRQGSQCLTYGGFHEANVFTGECTGWTQPGVGSQQWAPNASAGTLVVVDNAEKVLDVYDCNTVGAQAVQVCTAGSPPGDCWSTPTGPPGCGALGQHWRFDFTSSTPSPIASAISVGGAPYASCLAAAPLPPPPVDIQLQVWAKPMVDGSVAFVAFNRGTANLTANVTWGMLGWPDAQAATLRDLWAHADVPGQFQGLFTTPVPPHSAAMFRAYKAA